MESTASSRLTRNSHLKRMVLSNSMKTSFNVNLNQTLDFLLYCKSQYLHFKNIYTLAKINKTSKYPKWSMLSCRIVSMISICQKL